MRLIRLSYMIFSIILLSSQAVSYADLQDAQAFQNVCHKNVNELPNHLLRWLPQTHTTVYNAYLSVMSGINADNWEIKLGKSMQIINDFIATLPEASRDMMFNEFGDFQNCVVEKYYSNDSRAIEALAR